MMTSVDTVKHGEQLYGQLCGICREVTRGMFPDLCYSGTLHAAKAFDAIVLRGARSANGMRSFAGVLTAEQSDAIRNYFIARALEPEADPQGRPPGSRQR